MNNILLVGAGKMGGALATRWKAVGVGKSILIVDPVNGDIADVSDVPSTFKSDVIVFAVKPSILKEIISAYKPHADSNTLLMSIAAGKPISFFERHLGNHIHIVRCMPNLPASIGQGMSVACANVHVTQAQRQYAETLLRAAGDVIWTENEKILDAVTALSGSGPAYVFLLIEMLTKAGADIGLPQDMAEHLARKTVTGSAALAAASPLPAAALRENVTSPGGTTEAALKILMNGKMQELISSALIGAWKRARDLSD